jgi:hypothetical protein
MDSMRPAHKRRDPIPNPDKTEDNAMHRSPIILLAVALAGCGVEVAGTAATVGAARVEEAKQAQQNKEQFEQRLDATMQAAQQQREAAEQASQQ